MKIDKKEIEEKYWQFRHYLGDSHPETKKAREDYYKYCVEEAKV